MSSIRRLTWHAPRWPAKAALKRGVRLNWPMLLGSAPLSVRNLMVSVSPPPVTGKTLITANTAITTWWCQCHLHLSQGIHLVCNEYYNKIMHHTQTPRMHAGTHTHTNNIPSHTLCPFTKQWHKGEWCLWFKSATGHWHFMDQWCQIIRQRVYNIPMNLTVHSKLVQDPVQGSRHNIF